jgi:hypothetical protein
MRTIFDKVNIERIQFESGNNEVRVVCTITQQASTFKSELWINFSDLNVLLSKIQNENASVDVSSLFEQVIFEDGNSYYSFNSHQSGLENMWLEEVTLFNPLRQIRA